MEGDSGGGGMVRYSRGLFDLFCRGEVFRTCVVIRTRKRTYATRKT